MHVKRNFRLLDQARELRREMTSQERKLWYEYLRNYPVRIYKQRIIESFVADFYCSSAKLVIEIDGSQHYTSQDRAYDEEQRLMMLRYGIDTIRIANADIDHNFYAVCVQIDYEIQRRMKALSVTAEPCQLPLKGEPGPDEP